MTVLSFIAFCVYAGVVKLQLDAMRDTNVKADLALRISERAWSPSTEIAGAEIQNDVATFRVKILNSGKTPDIQPA